jgi:hypothetical protein
VLSCCGRGRICAGRPQLAQAGAVSDPSHLLPAPLVILLLFRFPVYAAFSVFPLILRTEPAPHSPLLAQMRSRTEQHVVLEARLGAQTSALEQARAALSLAEVERNRAVADAKVAEQLKANRCVFGAARADWRSRPCVP